MAHLSRPHRPAIHHQSAPRKKFRFLKPAAGLVAQTTGFTLLEMVAVLFVVGMTSSIVLPRLPAIKASLEFALQRDSFEQAMNGLAYQAFKESQDFVLAGSYDANGPVGEPPGSKTDTDILSRMRVVPLVDKTRVVLPSVTPGTPAIPLPEGWRVEFSTPIQYRASGYCTGGTADVEIKGRHYTYLFKAPLCEVVLEH